MYSSGVCISPPCAQPRQARGCPRRARRWRRWRRRRARPAARAARARGARSRAAAVAGRGARPGGGRAPRPRAPAEARPPAGAGPARSASSTASSSARCSITSSACAAIALTAVPPSMRPMFVLASRRGGRLSARAMRQTSSIALGRPRLAQEWPPGPRTPMRARRLPTASTATCRRPWPSSASASSRLQVRAGGARAREVAESLLADRERDGEPLRPRSRAICSMTGPRTHGGGVVADARAAQPAALEHRLVRQVAREHRVHVREQQHARAAVVEAPDQVARGVGARAVRRALRRRSSQAMRSPSSNVGAGTRASASRSSRASSTALTPRGRYQRGEQAQAAMAPGWRSALRARKAAAASIAASTLKPRSRAWAISMTCSTASAS